MSAGANNLGSSQSFTSGGGLLSITVAALGVVVGAAATVTGYISAGISIDGGTYIPLSYSQIPQDSSYNCRVSCSALYRTTLSAGSHTVQVKVYASSVSGGMNLYCRPSSVPNGEKLAIRVDEGA